MGIAALYKGISRVPRQRPNDGNRPPQVFETASFLPKASVPSSQDTSKQIVAKSGHGPEQPLRQAENQPCLDDQAKTPERQGDPEQVQRADIGEPSDERMLAGASSRQTNSGHRATIVVRSDG
jgi:hypothetical protein